MSVTEPENLANVGWNGDTVETEVTNDPRNAGFPCRKADGGLVFIVKKTVAGLQTILQDAEGNLYVAFGEQGLVREYDAAEEGEVEVDTTPLDSESKKQLQAKDELPATDLDVAVKTAEAAGPDADAAAEKAIKESDQNVKASGSTTKAKSDSK